MSVLRIPLFIGLSSLISIIFYLINLIQPEISLHTISVTVLINIFSWYSAWFIKGLINLLPSLKVDPTNKWILITGCDTGFGHRTAVKSIDFGFKVFAGCLFPDGDGAKQLRKSIKDPKSLVILKLDVTSFEDIESALDTVKKTMRPNEKLHGLVNNAGIVRPTEFEWDSFDNFYQTLNVNILGMARVTKTFLPLIRKARGRVVNIASLSARFSCPLGTAYAVSKHAAAGFSENLKIEMRKFGVMVIGIEPGLYKTNITNGQVLAKSLENAWKNTPEDIKNDYGQRYFARVFRSVGLIDLARALPDIPYINDTNPNCVVDTIITALVAFDPDTRYAVVPTIVIPFVGIAEMIHPDFQDLGYKIMHWVLGINKPYPKMSVD